MSNHLTAMTRGWPTTTQLAERMGNLSNNPAQFVSHLRKSKKLFGVWSPQDDGTYIHPTFQFGDGYTLSPQMPELLEALEAIPGFSDDPDGMKGGDPGGWRRLSWLYRPREELSERTLSEARLITRGMAALCALTATDGTDDTPRAPADVWCEAPDAVIALAHRDADDDCAVI